jgi:hypothetical protein
VFANEKLDQIFDTVSHKSAAGLLLLSRRVAPLGSSGEDLQGCCARLVQRDAALRPDRVFAQPRARTAGAIKHDEHLAALWGDLDAETGTATIPVNIVPCPRGECINRSFGQLYSRHGATLSDK